MDFKFLFFDTETTGNLPADRLCQIAWSVGTEQHSALFKPPVSISFESMAVHHITESMIASKPGFKFSSEHAELKKLFASDDVIAVAHNCVFDMAMIAKEGLVPQKYICTLRIARYLDPENKIPSYRLQYLRYFLGLEINQTVTAHDALGDVIVLEALFWRLFKKMKEGNKSDAEVIDEMLEISSKPSIFKRFNFGKYKDKQVMDVAKTDRGYLEWLLNQKMQNEADEEDWIYTLKQALGK